MWAGHNILKFDCVRIQEAFEEIGRPSPQPRGTIDTLPLLTQKFGKRAGNMKVKFSFGGINCVEFVVKRVAWK